MLPTGPVAFCSLGMFPWVLYVLSWCSTHVAATMRVGVLYVRVRTGLRLMETPIDAVGPDTARRTGLSYRKWPHW